MWLPSLKIKIISGKKLKNYETLTSKLESVDTAVRCSSTATSEKISVTGFGLILVPISVGVASALSNGNKVLHRLILKIQHKKKTN